MRSPPTAWSSSCKRALSYWLASFISARRNRSRRARGTTAPVFPPKDGTHPAQKRVNIPYFSPLLFVRCDVCCCGAVAPRVTVALLGRFLPRLGPLATASGPFFFARVLSASTGNAAHSSTARRRSPERSSNNPSVRDKEARRAGGRATPPLFYSAAAR